MSWWYTSFWRNDLKPHACNRGSPVPRIYNGKLNVSAVCSSYVNAGVFRVPSVYTVKAVAQLAAVTLLVQPSPS